MNILLLGKNGQVGWELQRALSPLGVVTALGHDSPGPVQCPELRADFSQPEQVAALVRAVRLSGGLVARLGEAWSLPGR